jgi:preprotein translocase subunit SecG
MNILTFIVSLGFFALTICLCTILSALQRIANQLSAIKDRLP